LPIATQLRFVKYSRLASDAEMREETTSIITLPLPITIPDTSSIRTNSIDMNGFGNLSSDSIRSMAGNAKSVIGSAGDTSLSSIMSMGESAFNNAVKSGNTDPQFLLKMLALTPKSFDFMSKDIAQSFGGVVTNPHVTTVFEGVNLKSYHLEWRLSPRSFDETRQLKQIIDTIKMCTHPEEILNGYGLDYPDLCYVEFTGAAKEYLPKFQRSFVTSVVASPDSMSGVTLYESGAPTTYNVQLSFTELNIVTRNVLRKQNG
jgi:hypothetical protein